jgi:hypothetical protein
LQLYAFLISPIRSTCLVHLILLGFITLIIFGTNYKFYPASCYFLPLRSNYSLHHLNLCTFLIARDEVSLAQK